MDALVHDLIKFSFFVAIGALMRECLLVARAMNRKHRIIWAAFVVCFLYLTAISL